MPVPAPPIDERSREQLAQRTAQLVREYTDWQGSNADAGQALIELFARMADQVIRRLNQMPEKHLRAFLELIGVQITPPQVAQAPLTFQLTRGASEALVPAGTQVVAGPAEPAAPLEPAAPDTTPAAGAAGEEQEIVFETVRELVLTPSELVAVHARCPAADTYGTFAALANGTGEPQAVFECTSRMNHCLYLAHDELLAIREPKIVTLQLRPADGKQLDQLDLRWSCWDGSAWQPVADPRSQQQPDGSYAISLEDLPLLPDPLQPLAILDQRENTYAAHWLQVELGPDQALPAADERPAIAAMSVQVHCANAGLAPDLGFADTSGIDVRKQHYPFGIEPVYGNCFYLTHSELFARPGAEICLNIRLANPATPTPAYPVAAVKPSPDLRLAWEYWNGRQWLSLLSNQAWNGRPMPDELLVDPIATILPGDDVILSGQCPGDHSVTVEEQLWDGSGQANASKTDGGWEARIYNLSPGVHSFRITSERYYEIRGRRWIIVYNPYDQPEPIPVEVTLEPDGRSPQQRRVRVRTAPGRPVLVRNAVASETLQGNSGDDGEFVVEIDLQPGRNDILALVYDDEQRAVGGNIVSAVLLPEQPPAAETAQTIQDGTWGLTHSGELRFHLPTDAAAVSVNGAEQTWIRARIVAGSYGSPASYELLRDDTGSLVRDRRTGLPLYEFRPATFRPPMIESIGLSYTSTPRPLVHVLSENDFFVADHSAAAHPASQETFQPFRPSHDSEPSLYLGFNRSFGNRPVTLYFGIVPTAATAGRFTWDYRRSPTATTAEQQSIWSDLAVERDETRNFSQSGLVTFIAPSDMLPGSDFGLREHLYWLRLRWLAAESGAAADAAPPAEQTSADPITGQKRASPVLERILTNTMWARQGMTVRNEVLGSSTGEAGQAFNIRRTPILAGQQLEVRERLAEEEQLRLQAQGYPSRQVETSVGISHECWVRWREVRDFHSSTATDRHYVLNRLSGELHFGNGRYGMLPPPGRENIRIAEYRWGGGIRGNVPAGAIGKLKTTIPYVDAVANHSPASGGADHEAIERVKERGPKQLRHRDRAVTFEDLEDLAIQATPEVARALAITPDAASYRVNPEGRVRLVILPNSSDRQPTPDPQLIRFVTDYLDARRAAALSLQVGGLSATEWIAVKVSIKVHPSSLEQASQLQATIQARLQRFLHPLTGGLEEHGWQFGQRLHTSELYRLIEAIDGIDHFSIENVTYRWLGPGDEPGQTVQQHDIDELKEHPGLFLVCSGTEHTITLV